MANGRCGLGLLFYKPSIQLNDGTCASGRKVLFSISVSNTTIDHDEQIAAHYDLNTVMEPMSLSIFLLAYALGPLVLSPLSELFGRKWVSLAVAA